MRVIDVAESAMRGCDGERRKEEIVEKKEKGKKVEEKRK
jgi:hypothetical protein